MSLCEMSCVTLMFYAKSMTHETMEGILGKSSFLLSCVVLCENGCQELLYV